MVGYRSRVEDDLKRWHAAGWVSAEGLSAISADLASRRRAIAVPHILALLGGVLLCFGAMTFVAANWQTLAKFVRIGILVAAMIASYGAAYELFRRQLDGFAHAAVLVGSGIYGAAIMLIAQMYHIDGHPPDAVLTWGVGTALAGLLLRSNPALVLGALLFGLWSAWETLIIPGVHWAFLPVIIVMGVASLAVTRWPPLFLLLALELGGWIFILGLKSVDPVTLFWNENLLRFEVPAIVGFLLFALATLARSAIDRVVPIGRGLAAIMLAPALAAVWCLEFVQPKHAGVPLVVWYVAVLAGLIALIAYALRDENRPVLWLAYAAFSVELVSIYFKTLGTLLNTSLFFVSAGVLVIGLSWVAWRLRGHALATAGGR